MDAQPIITEAMEAIISQEIESRDRDREELYRGKLEELKGDMYKTLDSHLDRFIRDAIGEDGIADLAIYRKYKPMIDSIVGILQSNGVAVDSVQAPELKVNKYGFPTNNVQDISLIPNSTKNPVGLSISEDYKGAIDDNQNLHSRVEELQGQLSNLNQEYKKMEAKNFILESLAGMSKAIITEATDHFKDSTKEELEAEDGKIIKEWLHGRGTSGKYKGLQVIENNELEDNSTEAQIDKAREALHESSMPYGKIAEARVKAANNGEVRQPMKDFVVPGLAKKNVEVVPLSEMSNKLDPQIERALSDLTRSSGGWRKRAEGNKQ